jgi:hypothetical protein
MRWYKNLYISKEAQPERKNIIKNIKRNKSVLFAYLIIIENNDSNKNRGILTIVHSIFFLRNYTKKDNVIIIGIACGRMDAFRLAGSIIYEVYNKTGGFDIKKYIV